MERVIEMGILSLDDLVAVYLDVTGKSLGAEGAFFVDVFVLEEEVSFVFSIVVSVLLLLEA